MTYARMIVIAPVERLAELRQFVTDHIDRKGGNGWFVECLSAEGTAPATHGWASFQATGDEAALWQSTYSEDAEVGIYIDNPPQEALTQEGLQLIAVQAD